MRTKLTLGLVIIGTIAVAVPAGATTARPGAPTITSVTPGARAVTVSFKKPAKAPAGGFGYNAVCRSSDDGQARGSFATASPIRVTSLSAGHTYTCRVQVLITGGTFGPWSPESAKVVPLKEQQTTVPEAPKLLYVHPGKASISVGVGRLDHSGGLKVTRYVAKCVSSNGGHSNKQQGSISPIKVDHLTGAKTYTCSVAARNAKGFGAFSAPSKPVVTLPA
jgi:Fibronectin type III domain